MKGVGVKVNVHDTVKKSSREWVFYDFPITVGRLETSDLEIDDPMVSKQHLTLTLRNHSVWVTDDESRNGTVITGGVRLKSGESRDLSTLGDTFAIGHLVFNVTVVNAANRMRDDRERGGVLLSGRLGNTPELVRRPMPNPGQAIRAAVDSVKPDCQAATVANEKRRDAITARFESLAAVDRSEYLRLLAYEEPDVTDDPQFQALAARLALPMTELRAPNRLSVEEASHRVLQELAAWYGVPSTMASLGEVIRFGRKLQDVCDALFSSVIPLREGLKMFGEKFGIEHGAAKNDVMVWLDRARTEQDVGAALLNSTTTAGDSWVAVRAICSDYMMNLMSLPVAMMEGVQALLNELAPNAIESQIADQPWYARTLFRAESVWKVYARRHNDLTSEDGETFRRLFGNEFASAYNQMFKSGEEAEANRARQRQARLRPVLAGESRVVEMNGKRGTPPPTNGTVVMRAGSKPPMGR